jgi:HTH-type transcriptional regulator / antitoxin HigA
LEITFRTSKLAKLCNSAKEMQKKLGKPNAEKLQQRLNELAAAETLEDMRQLPGALCLIPEIPGGKISGAAKWLAPHKAMIAINLRGKKSDLFWFTFFHEAGHVLLDSKKEAFMDVGYSNDPCEKAANEFARWTLIPTQYDRRLKTLRTEKEVRLFASEIDIDAGVVVGRLQYEKYIPYTHLNQLKSTFQWT